MISRFNDVFYPIAAFVQTKIFEPIAQNRTIALIAAAALGALVLAFLAARTFKINLFAKVSSLLSLDQAAQIAYARAQFDKCLKKSGAGNDERILDNYVRILKQAGRNPSALSAYERWKIAKPPSINVSLKYARELYQQKQYSLAHVEYFYGLQSFPSQIDLLREYPKALRKAGRIAEALQEFKNYLAKYPADSSIRNKYARALLENDQPEKAAQEYQRVLSSHDPNDAKAKAGHAAAIAAHILIMKGFAQDLAGQGDFEKAADIYQKVLASKPDDQIAQRGLASVLKDLTKQTLKRAAELYREDNYEEAIAIYEEALAQDPENEKIRRKFARCLDAYGNDLWNRKEYEEAVEQFKRAFEIIPAEEKLGQLSQTNILWSYFETLRELGRSEEERIEECKKLLEEHPKNSHLLTKYADLLFSDEQYDEAAVSYLKAFEVNPTDELIGNYFESLQMSGKTDEELVDVLQRLLKEHPENTKMLEMDRVVQKVLLSKENKNEEADKFDK